MTEFKLIAGFPGYRVGDDGSVWSSKRGSWKQLKPVKDRYGRLQVSLRHVNGRVIHKKVHRLVLEAFVGPCPPGMECRHFPDRDPRNNKATNLCWGTRQENEDDKVIHGTRPVGDKHWTRAKPGRVPRGAEHWTRKKPELSPRGEAHHSATVTVKQVLKARKMFSTGDYTITAIAAVIGVSRMIISDIVHRKTWKHV